jgi:hypothetical protein
MRQLIHQALLQTTLHHRLYESFYFFETTKLNSVYYIIFQLLNWLALHPYSKA